MFTQPSVDFDYDEVDRGNPLASEICEASPKKTSDSITLGKIYGTLLTYGGVNPRQFFVTANIVAYVLGFHPGQSQNMEKIAAGIGMEKAAFARRVNIIRRLMHSRGSILPTIAGEWSKNSRKSIQQKTKRTHEHRINGNKSRRSISHYCRAVEAAGA